MELVEHVQACIVLGDKETSKLPKEASYDNLSGLSSNKVRHFFNNLCSIPKKRHLEVGIHTGSTLISAGYKNELDFIAGIDNFGMPFKGNPRKELFKNLGFFNSNLPPVHIIESDCWQVNRQSLGLFDTYFYDGAHDVKSQKRAIVHFWDNLEDEAVIVVDDFDVKNVNKGTWHGIDALRARKKIVQHWHLRGGNATTRVNLWWGGLGVFVIDKRR